MVILKAEHLQSGYQGTPAVSYTHLPVYLCLFRDGRTVKLDKSAPDFTSKRREKTFDIDTAAKKVLL